MRVILCALLLAGCAQTAPAILTSCPVLKTYTAAEQKRMADEMAALPAGAALRGAMDDYAGLRNQVRACRGER